MTTTLMEYRSGGRIQRRIANLAHRLSNDSLQPHDSNDKFTEPTIETFIIYRLNYEDIPIKGIQKIEER
jgi:hypothetical protein